jgi:hypothetical protein
MSGTIVIVNGMASLASPASRGAQPLARIDGPNGYRVRGNRAGQFDVVAGTYRVRVSWASFHSNTIRLEVREGTRHHVVVSATPLYALTRIPLIGMLPQLAGSMIPGTALRLTLTTP